MAVGSEKYSVTSATAVLIASVPAVSGFGPAGTVVLNTDQTIFLGGPNVSSSNGYQLTSTAAPLNIALYSGDVLYAVASSTTANVTVLQT